jgi:hypothetical protein
MQKALETRRGGRLDIVDNADEPRLNEEDVPPEALQPIPIGPRRVAAYIAEGTLSVQHISYCWS